MYCTKCGNELKNNEQFCPNCGTKSGTSGKPVNFNISMEDIKTKTIEMKSNFSSGMEDLGKMQILLFANIGLILLSMILAITPVFKVDAILGVSQSMSMFDDMNGIRMISVILYIVSVVFLLIPMLLKKTWKTIFFLPAKIVTIFNLLWFFLVLLVGLNEVDSSGYSSMADFTLTATGWLFLIATVTAIILTFKLSHDFKQRKIIDTKVDSDTNDIASK